MENMDYNDNEDVIDEQWGQHNADPVNDNVSDNEDNDSNPDEADEGPERAKKLKEEVVEEIDSGQACPICMDVWSNGGEHRLCCLRCGHLFGHSCILRWLKQGCTSGTRRCPQCNRKAAIKDIRVLYAKKLSAVDTTELDNLKTDLNNVTAERNRLQMELSRFNLRQSLYDSQLKSLKSRIAELETQQTDLNIQLKQGSSRTSTRKFHLERTLDICKESECRVLDYNEWLNCLVVSQKSANSVFPGYGVKKIDTENFQPLQFIFLHSQQIRDVAFHSVQKEILLSVGFDKCAKITDIQNNVVVHTYHTESQLWSCCWSGNSSNIFMVGAQNGTITKFDTRQTGSPVEIVESPRDRTPVVSLASIPSCSRRTACSGGFIACRLNSCYGYEYRDAKYEHKQIHIQGPFMSVRYDEKNHHILISCRPNATIPHARHVVCTIQAGTENEIACNVIYDFNGGSSQQLLSRPCHVNIDDDTYVAAHQESTKSIPLWSVSKGTQDYSIPVSDPIVDLCSFEIKHNIFLATLAKKKLRIYNYG
ncbi:E3 ubiquitin-protein ligase RFWD3-like isoform X2 [Cephus cinctus]|uniref:RING-type E3 ubiquitin transferase n=1 Tax=Cephus cinctus TaxID=211228 RepID=A0AAJ7FLW8_CEPCN|nr:E3 ubiquitin-protein ligase RFWD3-like isoform X2 [Cephus cinctus]